MAYTVTRRAYVAANPKDEYYVQLAERGYVAPNSDSNDMTPGGILFFIVLGTAAGLVGALNSGDLSTIIGTTLLSVGAIYAGLVALVNASPRRRLHNRRLQQAADSGNIRTIWVEDPNGGG